MNNLDLSVIESSFDDFDNLFASDSPGIVEEAVNISEEAHVFESKPQLVPYDQGRAKLKEEGLSFQKPIETEEEAPKPKTGKKFIIYNHFIDKFNSKAIRREMTPSVCTVCGFDVVEKKHGRWGLVPREEQQLAIAALAAHKKAVHTLGDLHIIDESELPKQWLGNNRL